MFRLPPSRATAPIVEPSQAPRWWVLTVIHQALREAVYILIGLARRCRPSALLRHGGARLLGRIDAPTPPIDKSSGKKHKRLLFIRHGQGDHNASIKNWGTVDPDLNAAGERQVAELSEQIQPFVGEIELVACSPLTRALQTATGGLAGCNSSTPWCVNPLLRERLGAPCDTGRSHTELLRCFPEMNNWEGIDDLDEVWWSTSTEYRLYDRIEAFVEWIHQRPEMCIAVVGHNGLFSRILGRHLKNCEFEWVYWTTKTDTSNET